MISAIYSILAGTPAVNSLVGGQLEPRIYPLVLDQGCDLPAISMQIISNVPEYCKSGRVEDQYRVSINVFAERYAEMEAVAKAVKNTLDGIKGQYGAIKITSSRLANEADLNEKGDEVYHKAIDFIINANS